MPGFFSIQSQGLSRAFLLDLVAVKYIDYRMKVVEPFINFKMTQEQFFYDKH